MPFGVLRSRAARFARMSFYNEAWNGWLRGPTGLSPVAVCKERCERMLWMVGLYGLILASYLAALGVRVAGVPARERYWSQCDRCGMRLHALDLIPVLSWLFLGGRCRFCKQPIALLYPIAETVMASLGVLAYLQDGDSWETGVVWMAIAVLGVLSVADAISLTLPDKVLYPGIGAMIILRMAVHPFGFDSYLFAALAGYAFLALVFYVNRSGIGFGDVKLFFFVGLVVGMPEVWIVLSLASFIGLAVAGIMCACGRYAHGRKLPFGPPIALATVIVALYGQGMLAAYLQLARTSLS